MRCVNSVFQFEEVIKKSRFIGYILPCASEAEVTQSLNQLQAEHPNASHIAFAYRVNTPKGLVIRFHDAGEPSGTAGKPILQHLEGKQLINLVVAIVRYFGGIKLGAGGLTRAYGNTAKKVIEIATIVDYIEYETLTFKLDYPQMQNFEYQLKKLDGQVINQDFSDCIFLTIRIPTTHRQALQRLFPT